MSLDMSTHARGWYFMLHSVCWNVGMQERIKDALKKSFRLERRQAEHECFLWLPADVWLCMRLSNWIGHRKQNHCQGQQAEREPKNMWGTSENLSSC